MEMGVAQYEPLNQDGFDREEPPQTKTPAQRYAEMAKGSTS